VYNYAIAVKISLTKIPSVLRKLALPWEIEISLNIIHEEGAVIIVETLDEQRKNNVLELLDGRLGLLVAGDIIPGVLGKRRALKEYSGDIPQNLQVGDCLHLICESGILGEIKGKSQYCLEPIQVKVLGSLINQGQPANIKNWAIAWQDNLKIMAPIVGIVATGMDTGKTTAACQIIKHFKNKGKVAAAKLTGIAFEQDLLKFRDYGATPVLNFLDAGLPSTCGNPEDVIKAALGILTELDKSRPDLIIVEFGDGILGEYNVDKLLQCPAINQNLATTIIGANDLAGAWGAKEILQRYGISIGAITGPVANSETAIAFIEKNLGIIAETNLEEMPKTIQLIEKWILPL